MRLKQPAVIEFLIVESFAPIDIHSSMIAAYGVACVDRNTDRRWACGSRAENSGWSSMHDKPHYKWPKTADSAKHRERVTDS